MPNNIATPTPLRPARPTSRRHAPDTARRRAGRLVARRRAGGGSSARPAASGARRWAIAGAVVGSLAALVWNAPAQWLASAVGRASGQRVLLAEARGTVWSGSAVPVLSGGPGSREASTLPGRLAWQVRPAWSAGPALRVQLAQDCCLGAPATLTLRPGIGRIALSLEPAAEVIGEWPSAWLGGLGTPWNTLQLGGRLRLRSPGLRLESVQGRWQVDGRATLELDELSSRLSTLPVLGSYRLDLSGEPGTAGALLLLSTREGALQLSASGRWDASGVRLRGEARAAAPEHEAVLGNLLNIIGRRQGARSVLSIG
ncbi:type II secretion system protein N [Piscinibacter sakaiensis]|uniref:General secretion pathway protein N n=1 Tax=Piscinibacter sakaiensis TaxID=1547922 RepID=A0A0K8NW03_PISS1|nr:type II secretion system protein N [Piscinibacter sakaiensis]GAP34553.1 general secretion pathway protein N [Piscinibacter sakaiensis]